VLRQETHILGPKDTSVPPVTEGIVGGTSGTRVRAWRCSLSRLTPCGCGRTRQGETQSCSRSCSHIARETAETPLNQRSDTRIAYPHAAESRAAPRRHRVTATSDHRPSHTGHSAVSVWRGISWTLVTLCGGHGDSRHQTKATQDSARQEALR
jgi:hypothetical protein